MAVVPKSKESLKKTLANAEKMLAKGTLNQKAFDTIKKNVESELAK